MSLAMKNAGFPCPDPHGIAMTNLLELPGQVSPVAAVELKPKAGILPLPGTVHPDNSIKCKVSRFFLHQTLKLLQV
jgi:hypothetical protein